MPEQGTPTMGDEAQKRNTDCVYFLASPLTCKKGNDCEYRHSEAARINPRDCWFWLGGNCLNANCPFRHPPLDGRPGSTPTSGTLPTPSSMASPAASAVTALAATASAAAAAPPSSVASKSRIPCFFFSQGFCTKGEKCAFMHGPTLASRTESAVYQRPPKAPVAKVMDVGGKPPSVINGNDSTARRQVPKRLSSTFERGPINQSGSQSVPVKTAVPAQEVSSIVKDPERVKIAENSQMSSISKHQLPIGDEKAKQSSVSGDRSHKVQNTRAGENRPQRPQSKDEKARQGHLSGDRSNHVQNLDDRSRQGETRLLRPHPGDEHGRQVQAGGDRLRQGLSGAERKQNGFESEEWWKESSPGFDVLVDDEADQLMYPEDGEYLPHLDNVLESGRAHSRGRMTHSDDLSDFEHERTRVYDQLGYYDASDKYEHGSYELQERQLSYDQVGSSDHISRQRSVPYHAKTSEGALGRDRRGMIIEQDIQHSSNDLRNHLVERRKNDKVQHLTTESHSRRAHQDSANKFHHNRRHQDDRVKQEALSRGQVTTQQGTRTNRRPSGRADSGGTKRPYHDIGSDYEAASPDKVPLRSSPKKRPVNDDLRLKLKDRESGRYASEAVSDSEAKGYATFNRKKFEQKKEPANFAGPKSLAQIKAEKRRVGAEDNFKAVEGFDGSKSTFGDQHPVLAIKSQIEQVSGSSIGKPLDDGSSSEERKGTLSTLSHHESIKTSDFKAPKTLSLILKEKKEPESNGDAKFEETRKEPSPKTSPSTQGVRINQISSANLLSLDVSKDAGDRRILPGANDTTYLFPKGFKVCESEHDDSPGQPLSNLEDNEMPLQEGLASSLSGMREEKMEETHGNLVDEDFKGETVSSDDMMEDGIDGGDNASDAEYGFDDDEEDDFAKKLGGFFT